MIRSRIMVKMAPSNRRFNNFAGVWFLRLFRLSVVSLGVYAMAYMANLMKHESFQDSEKDPFGPFKYITIWNFLSQMTSFTLNIICDLLIGDQRKSKSSFILSLRDHIHNGIVLPFSIVSIF